MSISNIHTSFDICMACDIFCDSISKLLRNVLDYIKMYGLCNKSVLNLYNGTFKLLLSKCAFKED